MLRALGLFTTLLAAIVAFLGILVVMILPTLAVRRTFARWVARSALTVGGCPIRIKGLERLPEGHCVLVANHASYLDGIVLQGVMPNRFAFVIKKEASKVFFIGTLLNRLGSAFVDRTGKDTRGSSGREILARADSGEALAFFPEGTFRGAPGLGAFRPGAFLTAIRTAVPVVPVIIRGSRVAMGEGHWFMTPNWIEVEVLPEHAPPASGPGQAKRFMDQVRRDMLEHMDEPDLEVAADTDASP
jgi:1-acyl-sn-glycerol-3-phosphate acyltransferase